MSILDDHGTGTLMTDRLLLAIALENTAEGTHMAGAYVATDGTATVELLERVHIGWHNLTLNEPTTSPEIAKKYDDVVVAALPTPATTKETPQ